MLNRNISPNLVPPTKINISDAVVSTLTNNAPLLIINSGTQEVIKIDLIFGVVVIKYSTFVSLYLLSYSIMEAYKFFMTDKFILVLCKQINS